MSDSESTRDFSYHAPVAVAADETVTAHMDFSINDVRIRTAVPVPAGKTSLRIMLPVLRAFTEAFVNAAVESAAAQGEKVSCKAHCGACCRQLVPILESEAYQLRAAIDALPEPRRAHVLARFAEAKRDLEARGLWARIIDLQHLSEDPQAIGLDYFVAGIPCPFLEDESCSIHPERPLICREYLVASDPKFCAHPTASVIRKISPIAKMSAAAGMANDDPPGSRGRHVSLVALVDWVAAHSEPTPHRTGKELLESVMTHLLRKPVGDGVPAAQSESIMAQGAGAPSGSRGA